MSDIHSNIPRPVHFGLGNFPRVSDQDIEAFNQRQREYIAHGDDEAQQEEIPEAPISIVDDPDFIEFLAMQTSEIPTRYQPAIDVMTGDRNSERRRKAIAAEVIHALVGSACDETVKFIMGHYKVVKLDQDSEDKGE